MARDQRRPASAAYQNARCERQLATRSLRSAEPGRNRFQFAEESAATLLSCSTSPVASDELNARPDRTQEEWREEVKKTKNVPPRKKKLQKITHTQQRCVLPISDRKNTLFNASVPPTLVSTRISFSCASTLFRIKPPFARAFPRLSLVLFVRYRASPAVLHANWLRFFRSMVRLCLPTSSPPSTRWWASWWWLAP